MKKITLLFLVLLFFVFACNNKNESNYNTYPLKVTEGKGVWQNPDSFTKPVAIIAGIPKPKTAGKPTIKPTNLNIHIASIPKTVIAGIPKINIPGTDTFLLPKTIKAKGTTKPAKIPEVVMAKDMANKDQNPANFSFFKTLQGLKHNAIHCMLQDKTGNIWFGTEGGGAMRYDGKSFTNFTDKDGLANNVVWSILEDKAGNIWFGTNGGVSSYNGKSFTNFTDKEGLTNNVVWSILEDKSGNLWFGTYGGGVSRYDGTSFTNFTNKQGLADNVILSILEDKTGSLWFGTNSGGVSKYDGKSFTNFTDKEGLANNAVWSILEDKSGNLWFGSYGAGVSRYDGNRVEAIERGKNISQNNQEDLQKINGKLVKSFTNFTKKEGLTGNAVSSILEDRHGNLWFGTIGEGVSFYDGKSFTDFSEKNGLSNNYIWKIIEDKAGKIWISTDGGVCRYDGKSFTNFSDKEGLSNNIVFSILESKNGSMWFGTYGGGISCYNEKSFTNFTDKEGLTNNVVWSILEDKQGNIWFGTNGGGVSRYDGKCFTNFTAKDGLAGNIVLSIFEDKSGNIWFGTYGGGVSRYDGKFFTNFSVKDGLLNNVVWRILEDKARNIWFGTDGGVSCYNGNRVEAIEKGENIPQSKQPALKKINGKLVKSFTNFTSEEGLVNNIVWSILEDKAGNIWFGTEGGLSHYDGKYFTNFTEKEGLATNVVLSILEDKTGNIWFGTGKGLSKITKKNLAKLSLTPALSNGEGEKGFNPIKEALFYNYGYNDGFLGLNCRRNSVLQDSKGRIWWGTDVLTCYTPEGDITDTTAPVVQLKNIKLFGEEVAWTNLGAVSTDSTGKEIINSTSKDTTLGNGVVLHDIKFDGITKWYPLPQNLSLPYNNNNLTFNFIGIHMQSHNHINYQYKLQGLEENWSTITEHTEAHYGNLPAGDYTFKVKAMNQSGVWSEPFEFAFVVRPPWWQTWLFRIIAIVLSISGIWFYIKSREKKLVAEKEKLEKTVDERTAEVVKQKHFVEEKHKEITDSINYAERIQRSFLATKNVLDENLKDYFVFFQPKDVVSGDFYWASKLSNNQFALVTADSTGHGVPGAIMSLLNITSIESAIKDGYENPSDILNETRKTIIERLKKDGSVEGGKDGMDCSFILFDFINHKMTYAAANNPVWIVRGKEILEFKPDKMPVGKHDKDSVSFNQHKIELQKRDLVYTITDGLADQFGGPKGKKFMYKQVKQLLISIAHLSMEEQKEKLAYSLNNWKGNLEQVDDVTIVGIRI